MTKRRWWMAAALACLGVGIVVFFVTRTSTRAAAERLNRLVLAGNADAIWPYVTQQERDALGITRPTFDRLMAEFVRPAFSRVTRTQAVVAPAAGIEDAWTAETDFTNKAGATTGFEFEVTPSPDGPKAISLVSHLVICALMSDEKRPGDRFPYQAEARGIAKYAPQLAQLGLRGIVRENDQGAHFADWSDQLAYAEHRRDVLLGKAVRQPDE